MNGINGGRDGDPTRPLATLIPSAESTGTFTHSLPFQRCHRLRARLEAVSAGLSELSLLRERQERLVNEAIGRSRPQKNKTEPEEVFASTDREEDELVGDSDRNDRLPVPKDGDMLSAYVNLYNVSPLIM